MPKSTAVTVVKIRNLRTGICEICAQRLTTRAVEQPMMSRPPMISPQRMLLSSMNELSTSENGLRGGGGGMCSNTGSGSGAVSSSALMNDGTGSITISSSVAVNEAVTTDGGGVSTGGGVAMGLEAGTGSFFGAAVRGVTRLARSVWICLITCW